jgi:hypothetical protein
MILLQPRDDFARAGRQFSGITISWGKQRRNIGAEAR